MKRGGHKNAASLCTFSVTTTWPPRLTATSAAAAAAAAKSLQSCPTLCNPIDGSPPGSPVPGILQARTLEWVAISFSNAWKWKVKVKALSRVRLSATPRTAAFQAPPSMGFSRQEYWSGMPLPSPAEEPSGLQSMGSHRVGHDWSLWTWTQHSVLVLNYNFSLPLNWGCLHACSIRLGQWFFPSLLS